MRMYLPIYLLGYGSMFLSIYLSIYLSVFEVMAIVAENQLGNISSNLRRASQHFTFKLELISGVDFTISCLNFLDEAWWFFISRSFRNIVFIFIFLLWNFKNDFPGWIISMPR